MENGNGYSVRHYRAQPLWSFNVHCMHALLARCSFALHGIMYRFWNENSHIVNSFPALLDLAVSNAIEHSKQSDWLLNVLINSLRTLDNVLQMHDTHGCFHFIFHYFCYGFIHIAATSMCVLCFLCWECSGLRMKWTKNGVTFVSSHLVDIMLSLRCMQLWLSLARIAK